MKRRTCFFSTADGEMLTKLINNFAEKLEGKGGTLISISLSSVSENLEFETKIIHYAIVLFETD